MTQENSQLSIGVPKETFPDEQRVAIIPELVSLLKKKNLSIAVESGAGIRSGFSDTDYSEKGARIVNERAELFKSCDIIFQVRSLGANPEKGLSDLALFRSGQIVIGHFEPLSEPALITKTAATGVTSFAMELLPRITRAQGMDALSAMATVAGYKAVLIAAAASHKMFPLLMTAAGTISPAHVFIIGAGVAGLQAIATANRLGAVVNAYDVRPAVKEQVESLGAKFIELEITATEQEDKGGYAKAMDKEFYQRQQSLMSDVIAKSDIVITTAAVPGKKAPILITADMVKGMSSGSIIVDLAAERGGNCELTEPGKTVSVNGVKIIGPVNLSSTIPYHASQMYSRNLQSFVLNLVKDGNANLNLEDEIINDTMLTHKGEVVNQKVRELLGLGKTPQEQVRGEN